MIIKYFDERYNEFVCTDHCEDVKVSVIDAKDCIKRYNDLYPDKGPAQEGLVAIEAIEPNKVFIMSSRAERGINVIAPRQPIEMTKRIGYTKNGINCAIVTNMAAYLLNDDGKTIERII
jgi:hypothetical protein